VKWPFKRKPRITEEQYGRLMTSFGRTADKDPFVWQPSKALAERVVAEEQALAVAVDAAMYEGAARYHLELLAASWIMARDGSVPTETAEVFEEAVIWKLEPLVTGSGRLSRRLSALARGEGERDKKLNLDFSNKEARNPHET
jgi:hypothetical protein